MALASGSLGKLALESVIDQDPQAVLELLCSKRPKAVVDHVFREPALKRRCIVKASKLTIDESAISAE